MKRITLIAIIFSAIFGSCVKQKDCEGCVEGVLIPLKNPYDEGTNKAYAYFITENSERLSICNKLPAKYAKKDTVKVCAVLETKEMSITANRLPPEVIKCIEKID